MTAVVPERATRIRPVAPVSVLVGVDPVLVRPARRPDVRAAHHAIRHAVFVEEQGLFGDNGGTDVDAHDARDDVVHVLATHLGRPAGTVRLYPLGDGEWMGDRLAVLPEFRSAAIGGPLVRFAVATAGAHDGTRMHAHVQVANERFFHRLGWSTAGPREIYVGTEHVPMTTALQTPTTEWLAGPRPKCIMEP
ncbi:MSMEG_0567/Sll0786 family nitrogen starvation N-acetyltransferase [Pseudonocardia sp. WMMC193]|uniref:MSMEG_0567/Sll0786 family nitrogen starvation N-acetyltransferase n=1 Tax=Pseudonocardia sp. WMMC193 TaxID=2911965 RepID=UPI001F0306A1|nr:MSMEG_0567/Sll0786 family nitrogen starvation N-acetyltransferase [Pseudonocardia sp. WMMC193]MCF7550437.1 GNAT family N-acetyltransferase [Pseudonocardia sp. WMMC193]